MDKKLSRLLSSNSGFLFVILLVFTAMTAVLKQYILAGAELAIVCTLFIVYKVRVKRRAKDIRSYVEDLAFQIDDASKLSIVNFPLPIAIIKLNSREVIWGNNHFSEITQHKGNLFEMLITDVFPSYDNKWLMEGRQICPYELELNGRFYNIYGNIVENLSAGDTTNLLATLFLVDITDYCALREKHEKRRPIVAIIVVDSYDELYKGLSEAERSSLNVEIDDLLTNWAKPTGGIIRRLDRDRYLFVFEHKDYIGLVADKFSVLDNARNISNSMGINASLSIGIGKGECSFGELFRYASMGIDMALSRGGDQVVIKTPSNYEFFGGKTKQLEKRTKVKVRVTANALKQFIKESGSIFIVGHKSSDLDCIGAAAGLCAAVRACGKTPYIITDREKSNARELIDILAAQPQYSGVFINEDEAILLANAQSLCIVVDTCRPDRVEAPALLDTVKRLAMIDHHRRATDFIENSAITLHETYASSASELVTELLQYIVSPRDVLKIEAEGLLAGMVLDTKSFTMHTGVRTFEAAAYLKQLGADPLEVKRMFSGGMESYLKKYKVISKAKEIADGITLAVVDEQTDRALAGQAADEMMNISGVKASIVAFADGNDCAISARSFGEVNVQVLMEKIGGGGSLTMAGAQLKDTLPSAAEGLIRKTVAEYIDDIRANDGKDEIQ